MKAMIFAAGLGTRLRPLTDNVPKALIEINGRTLLEICINRLKEIGINDIVVNVHHHANQIIKYLERNNNFGINIKFSDETDLLLDTGGGLKKATHLLIGNEPILLHNVDIISNINLSQLISYHNNNNSLSTLAVMNRLSNRSFLINEKGILCGWQNTTTGEKIIVRDHDKLLQPVGYCGIAVIQPKFLKKITENNVFSIITVFLRLASKEEICTMLFNNVFWTDVGTIEKLEEIRKIESKML